MTVSFFLFVIGYACLLCLLIEPVVTAHKCWVERVMGYQKARKEGKFLNNVWLVSVQSFLGDYSPKYLIKLIENIFNFSLVFGVY